MPKFQSIDLITNILNINLRIRPKRAVYSHYLSLSAQLLRIACDSDICYNYIETDGCPAEGTIIKTCNILNYHINCYEAS
jgi:hypothetical protein